MEDEMKKDIFNAIKEHCEKKKITTVKTIQLHQKCPHKKTVALNEEGNAGIYCADCGKQLTKEC